MPSTNTIHKSIEISAPVAKVWEAITNPAHIAKWWSDSPIEVKTTWEPGSSIAFIGHWYGKPYVDNGVVLRFEKEKVLKFTCLSHITKLPEAIENHTIIEFNLTPLVSKTILQLTQTNFVMETIYQHWNFYWLVTLDILRRFVEG